MFPWFIKQLLYIHVFLTVLLRYNWHTALYKQHDLTYLGYCRYCCSECMEKYYISMYNIYRAVYIIFSKYVFIFFGWILRTGIAGLKGSFLFNLLRNLYTIFHSGCTSLHPHPQWPRVPFSPHSCQYFFVCNNHSDRCMGISY